MSTHDYSKLWAVAPLWARWIATDYDGTIYYFETRPEEFKRAPFGWMSGDEAVNIDGVKGNGSDWQNSLQEIPERERELNRWADTYETWTDVTRNEALILSAPAITENMYNERRRIRIEAGLIEGEQVEDDSELPGTWTHSDFEGGAPDVSRGPDWKPDTDNGDSWVPEVGTECYLIIGDQKHHVEIEGYSRNKDVVFVKYCGLHEFDYWFLHDDAEFRPIETPEQKAEREHSEKVDFALSFLGDGVVSSEVRDAVDTLISSGFTHPDQLKSEGKV